jgi:hypothetical protein
MKAILKVVTAEKEFTEDQKQTLKRVAIVLIQYNLSVSLITKERCVKVINLKIV